VCITTYQSINQSKHIAIAPYVASESEAQPDTKSKSNLKPNPNPNPTPKQQAIDSTKYSHMSYVSR